MRPRSTRTDRWSIVTRLKGGRLVVVPPDFFFFSRSSTVAGAFLFRAMEVGDELDEERADDAAGKRHQLWEMSREQRKSKRREERMRT